MRKKMATIAAVAAMAVFGALPASAAPADGKCVSNGVKALGGAGISAAATGNLLEGFDSNIVNVVILDHVFDNADLTESLLGITICD